MFYSRWRWMRDTVKWCLFLLVLGVGISPPFARRCLLPGILGFASTALRVCSGTPPSRGLCSLTTPWRITPVCHRGSDIFLSRDYCPPRVLSSSCLEISIFLSTALRLMAVFFSSSTAPWRPPSPRLNVSVPVFFFFPGGGYLPLFGDAYSLPLVMAIFSSCLPLCGGYLLLHRSGG